MSCHSATVGQIITSKAGKLTVLETWRVAKYIRICRIRCYCGIIFETQLNNIEKGFTNSCGCYNSKRSSERGYRHGHAKRGQNPSKTYFTWVNIKTKFTNKNDPKYHEYAERGIKLCEEWKSFENFLRDMGEKHDGFRMKRLDKGRGFEPGNCEWTPIKQLIHLAKSQNQ